MAESVLWHEKPLDELNSAEWERLCDGCGRCCLVKLEDEESGELHYTMLACNELDLESCRCRHYAERLSRVPDCIALTPANVTEYAWLPESCAYRLRAAGQPLPAWHPLISGSAETVHRAGISVRNFAISEAEADNSLDIEEYLLEDGP